MQKPHDIFGPGANLAARIVWDRVELERRLEACRALGFVIGQTGGTFDLTHVGHLRYLALAKEQCDILVVGVDTDARVKKRKGPTRPAVPEEERFEVLCHSRYVDLVVPKSDDEEHWELTKLVKADVVIVSEREYQDETELEELKRLVTGWGGKLMHVPSQAETSTTAKVRKLHLDVIQRVKQQLLDALAELEHPGKL